MAGNALHLLVTLAALSLLVSFIHLPTTKARHLVHETTSPENTPQMNDYESQTGNAETAGKDIVHGIMDLEINRDYPGSGANNRHTPNPPAKG